MNLTTALQAARQWPVEDRLELVFGLWDQLVEDGWQPEPTDDLAAELDRRLAAHEATRPTSAPAPRCWSASGGGNAVPSRRRRGGGAACERIVKDSFHETGPIRAKGVA